MLNFAASVEHASSSQDRAEMDHIRSVLVPRFVVPRLTWRRNEAFLVLFLDEALQVLGAEVMFKGDANGMSVDLRDVARAALLRGAASVVVAHNHPTGDPTPSAADVRFTRRLRVVMTLACIAVRDHVIVARQAVYSMAERGPWTAPLAELAEFLGEPNVLHAHATGSAS